MGDLFVKALIVQYGLAAIAYALGSHGWKSLYFVGALVISVAVLKLQ